MVAWRRVTCLQGKRWPIFCSLVEDIRVKTTAMNRATFVDVAHVVVQHHVTIGHANFKACGSLLSNLCSVDCVIRPADFALPSNDRV